MNYSDYIHKLTGQIARNRTVLKANTDILNGQAPAGCRGMSPRQMGELDARDGMGCQPSSYYSFRRARIEYIAGYLAVAPEDRGGRVLHATYTLSEGELSELYEQLQADDEAVDEAQGEQSDWRG